MIYDTFDRTKPHRCPIGHPEPEVCPCSTCYMARKYDKSRAALARAEAKNFAPSGSLTLAQNNNVEPDPVRGTTKEKIERQRRERFQEREKEWQEIQATEAAQQAYDLTENEWNKDLQSDLKEYLKGRHTQVCILTVDDAAKCALNIWSQKKEDGETIGSEVLGILDEIHSKIDMGIGLIAAAKVSKALGGLGVTVKQYFDAKGIERVIISSLWNDKKMHYATVNSLNIKKNHPYRISNPTIKQLGVLAEDTLNGFKKGAVLSLIISATINTNELVFNDDYHLVDWCGSMGSDLLKLLSVGAVIGAAVSLTVAFGVSVPLFVGALIWVGVDIIVSNIWDDYDVEERIVDSLKGVVDAE